MNFLNWRFTNSVIQPNPNTHILSCKVEHHFLGHLNFRSQYLTHHQRLQILNPLMLLILPQNHIMIEVWLQDCSLARKAHMSDQHDLRACQIIEQISLNYSMQLVFDRHVCMRHHFGQFSMGLLVDHWAGQPLGQLHFEFENILAWGAALRILTKHKPQLTDLKLVTVDG